MPNISIRTLAVMLYDICVVSIAFYLSIAVINHELIPRLIENQNLVFTLFFLITATKFTTFYFFGLYRAMIRFSSIPDLVRISKGVLVAVPLSAFGGVPLTNKNGDKMTINNDNSVTFNDTIYNSIIYVPLMYIVAAPVKNTNLVLSLGTDGLRGNACIVTIATLDKATNPVISAVYAINGPE